MNSRSTILLVALLALAALAPAGSASSPPEPVCPVCGDGFESVAVGHGVGLQVTEATTTIEIEENGDATWVVRNRVEDEHALDRLRNDSTLLEQLVSEALREPDGVWSRTEEIETSTADGVVSIRFRVSDFVTRTPGGVLRVDYLNAKSGIAKKIEENDTLRVTGPDGYAVTHAPTEGRVADGEVTWTGRTSYGQRDTVVFGTGDGMAADLWTTLSLALRIDGVIYGNLVRLFPALLLFGVLVTGFAVERRFDVGGNVRSLHRRDRTQTVDRTAAVLLAFGVIAIVYPVYESPAVFVGSLHPPAVHYSVLGVGLLYLVTGTLTRYVGLFDDRDQPFEALFMPLAVVPTMFVLLFLGTDPTPDYGTVTTVERFLNAFEGALLPLLVGLFLPLGYRSRTDTEGETMALAAGIFATYFLHVSLSTDVAKLKLRMGIGTSSEFDVVLMALFGLTIVAFGLPLYHLGRVLPTQNSGSSSGEASGSTSD